MKESNNGNNSGNDFEGWQKVSQKQSSRQKTIGFWKQTIKNIWMNANVTKNLILIHSSIYSYLSGSVTKQSNPSSPILPHVFQATLGDSEATLR